MKNEKIYRKEYMEKLSSYKDKRIIKVLTGIRRAGKSTILNEFKKQLISDGILEKISYLYIFEIHLHFEFRLKKHNSYCVYLHFQLYNCVIYFYPIIHYYYCLRNLWI